MKKAQISIIVPVYNAEKYLPRCLDSLINQTFKDIEILCINDGSTDGSLQILNEYAAKDERIKVILIEHSGSAKVRNVGLENAQGEYIMSCDSDDWYEADMCQRMFQAITSHNVDCVMCHTNIVWEDKANYRPIQEEYYNPDIKGVMKKNLYQLNVLLWNKIYKKSLIDKWKINFPTGYLHDDDCFWCKYSLVAHKVLIIQEKLYNYVIRKNSIMDDYYLNKQANYLDRLTILKNILLFAEEHKFLYKKSKALQGISSAQLKALGKFVNLQEIRHEIKDINKFLKSHKLYLSEDNLLNTYNSGIYSDKLKYYIFKGLSKITFGKKREKYEEKKKKLKQKIRDLENFLRS